MLGLFHKPTRAVTVRPRLNYTELQRRTNEQLMEALQTGNNDALMILFDRLHRGVYTIVLSYIRNPEKAEDIMQTVFLESFRKIARFDPANDNAQDWILRLAVRIAVDGTGTAR